MIVLILWAWLVRGTPPILTVIYQGSSAFSGGKRRSVSLRRFGRPGLASRLPDRTFERGL